VNRVLSLLLCVTVTVGVTVPQAERAGATPTTGVSTAGRAGPEGVGRFSAGRSPVPDLTKPLVPWRSSGDPAVAHRQPEPFRPASTAGSGFGLAHDADAQSDNWAGWVETGTRFTGVSADWVVPSVPPTESTEVSSTWIGIDGATNSSLIQAGTTQASEDGETDYFSWYEILPAASIVIGEVAPGDHMAVSITEVFPEVWAITVDDLTQSEGSTNDYVYSGPGASAEWIEEDPTNGETLGLFPFADFGSVEFTNLATSGVDLSAGSYTSLSLVDSGNQVITYPGAIDNGAFIVVYGVPPSVATTSLPSATTNIPYDATLEGTGGTAPYRWSIISQTAPDWLSLDSSTGELSGTATNAGTDYVALELTDAFGFEGLTILSIVVVPDPAPLIVGISPSLGSTLGGTPVTISGTGLTGTTSVEFGSTAATIVSCSYTDCDVVAPAGSAGSVAIGVTNPYGSTSTSLTPSITPYTYVTPATPEAYFALTPTRVCDTRTGGVKLACASGTTLGAGGVLTVDVAGNGGVPASGVSAVVVNVTAVHTTSHSFLTVFPGGEPEPTASNLNWIAGQTVPNLVTVGLSPGGTFEAENFNGSTDVIIDVEGYYAAGAPGEGLYNALPSPVRICDTRAGNPSGLSGTVLTQCEGQAPSPGNSLAVDVLGGVPATGVGAVVLNLTAVDATAAGHLTVYPADASAPLASNVNFTAGEVVPNRVIVPVGPGGVVDVLSSYGSPDILVDVAGWYTDDSDSSATGAEFTPAVTPIRVCDTRSGLSYATPCAGRTLGAGGTITVAVGGTDSIPADASSVVLNVTVTATTTPSHLTVYPAGQPLPTVSDLNWTAGRTVPNLVIATVGTGENVNVTNFNGSADVIVDVVGWFT